MGEHAPSDRLGEIVRPTAPEAATSEEERRKEERAESLGLPLLVDRTRGEFLDSKWFPLCHQIRSSMDRKKEIAI